MDFYIVSSPTGATFLEQRDRDIYNLLNELAELDPGSKALIDILHRLSKLQVGVQYLIDLLECRLVAVVSDTDLYWKFFRALRKVCGHWGLLPSSYYLLERLERVYDLPAARGDSADIWEGTYRGERVAIKSLRSSARGDPGEVEKRFFEEVVLWKQLRHPNIVPFLGVPIPTGLFPLFMVSPWMTNGNITEYLRANLDINCCALSIDVCNGIKFLHSLEIVHGNLKGANILIDSDKRACLTSFGLTSIRNDLEMNFNGSTQVSPPHEAYRWMAPELLSTLSSETSKASDIYALAMVVTEIFSGRLPFHGIPGTAVPYKVAQGMRPKRPDQTPDQGMSDEIWELVKKCWKQDWTERPTICFVLNRLRAAAP